MAAANSITRRCSVENCNKPAHARGWCGLHYQRWKRHGNPLALETAESIRGNPVATFWLHVTKAGPVPQACPELGPFWMWTSNKTGGYGHLSWGGKMRYTHVISWFLATGQWPGELDTLHRCDTPACVNPAHLYLGTHQDNMADRNAKGRQARGERHRDAKLTGEHVAEIRRAYVKGIVGVPRLAKRYGVSQRAIRQIIHRQTWRHV